MFRYSSESSSSDSGELKGSVNGYSFRRQLDSSSDSEVSENSSRDQHTYHSFSLELPGSMPPCSLQQHPSHNSSDSESRNSVDEDRNARPVAFGTNLKNTSVAELRDRLRSRGQPSGGSKSDLIKHLLGQEMEVAEGTVEDLKRYTVPELKEQLKAKQKSTSGSKTDLINRLLENEDEVEDGIEKDLKQCSVAELREKLKERGQPSGGSRSDLINRLLGQEVEMEEGTEEDLKRYTVKELKKKLTAMRLPTAKGNKQDLIDRLTGKEQPMPKEKWEKSNDKRFLLSLLKDTRPTSVRFMTAEEVNQRPPFNRWPLSYFRDYFETARRHVLNVEKIADEDNHDFLADTAANPRGTLTRRGNCAINCFIWDQILCTNPIYSICIGVPFWDTHTSRYHLKRDLLRAMSSNPPTHLNPKELWKSRECYQEFDLKTFRDHIAQQKRYFNTPPGWQTNRNKAANKKFEKEIAEMRNAWNEMHL